MAEGAHRWPRSEEHRMTPLMVLNLKGAGGYSKVAGRWPQSGLGKRGTPEEPSSISPLRVTAPARLWNVTSPRALLNVVSADGVRGGAPRGSLGRALGLHRGASVQVRAPPLLADYVASYKGESSPVRMGSSLVKMAINTQPCDNLQNTVRSVNCRGYFLGDENYSVLHRSIRNH